MRSHLAIVYVYYVNASGWYNVLLVDIILQYRTNIDSKRIIYNCHITFSLDIAKYDEGNEICM